MKIVFCIPGANPSRHFWRSWIPMLQFLERSELEYEVRNQYSADIYNARNMVLMDEEMKFDEQTIFGGAEYDYMVWMDMDSVFTPMQVMQLLAHEKDIVSAVVATTPQGNTALGRYGRDEEGEAYKENFTVQGIAAEADEDGLVELDYCGLGFVAVKRGVFEALPFPWFQHVIANPMGYQLRTSEDMGWAHRVKDAGFRIYADANVRIGHEKVVVM